MIAAAGLSAAEVHAAKLAAAQTVKPS